MAGQAFPAPKSRGGAEGGGTPGGTPGGRPPQGNGSKPGDRGPGDGSSGSRPDSSTTRQEARDGTDKSTTQDPIDLATGEVIFPQTDVALEGVLPLVLERTHLSSHRRGRLFGVSWASTLDQHLELDAAGVAYAAPDGMVLRFPLVNIPNVVTFPVEGARHRHLAMTGEGGYALTDVRTGRTLHFPAPGARTGWSRLPLAAVTDRNGVRIDLAYDEDGVLTEVRHSGGYRIAVDTAPFQNPEHDTTERRVTALRLLAHDDEGRPGDIVLMRYAYDARGDLAEVINESGRPLRFSYDDEHRMLGWRDRNGNGYEYAYDERGRAIAGTGTGGHLNTRLHFGEPDASGMRRTVQTDSLGHATTYVFNDAWQLVAQTDPLGNTTRYERDPYGRVLSHTDPLGNTTRYTYDEAGNITSISRPGETRTVALHNELNRPVQITGSDGTVWRQTWDKRGNLTSRTDPLGAVTTYGYNERGHLVEMTDPEGNVTRFETNDAGLPLTVTDPLGNVTRYRRNAFGRIAAVTDPVGGTTRLEWTIEGRPRTRVLPSGAAERWQYDANGDLIAYTDAMGRQTRTEYGPFGMPAVQSGADGARLELRYDSELRLASVTNPQGLVWRYEYDAAGRLVREVDFNGRTLQYEHDACGRLLSRRNGAGEVTRFLRNPLGKVVEQRAGDTVTEYTYDPAGRLSRAVGPGVDLRLSYDGNGRVTAQECNGRVLHISYDALGRRVRRRTPSGAETFWRYDPAGRLTELHTAGQALGFSYDAAGREVRRNIGPGVVMNQRWDADHRLIDQAMWSMAPAAAPQLLQHRAYGYQADGNITAINDRLRGPQSFELDQAGRVTGVHAHGWTERYSYGADGGLVHGTDSRGQADSLDAREFTGPRLQRAGRTSFEYDEQGRVTARHVRTLSGRRDSWRYGWDADDRLVSVSTPSGDVWQYFYDPFGRRVGKRRYVSGRLAEQIDFTWDGTTLVEEDSSDHDRRQIRSWTYDPGSFRPVTQTRKTWYKTQQAYDEEFYGIITDLVGTPRELVHSSGKMVHSAQSGLWGASQGRMNCPFSFPGQYHDDETGLDYNLHRYYDPTTGHYLSSDPIGLLGGVNPYAYVSNPTRKIDPTGLTENDPPYFRGTTLGWAGGESMQKAGVASVTSDPGVAAIFATQSASDHGGEGVVHIFRPGSLDGVEKLGPGYIPREAEMGLGIQATDLADRASQTIPVARARSILSEMGYDIPPNISVGDLNRVLETTPKLSSDEIQDFLNRAGSCG